MIDNCFLYDKIVTYLGFCAIHGRAHATRGKRVMTDHSNSHVSVGTVIPRPYGCSQMWKTYNVDDELGVKQKQYRATTTES